jgi:hypothetical protein
MNIFMAIGAFHPDLTETPFVLFFMAGKAGCCKMCSLKPECTGIMLVDGK